MGTPKRCAEPMHMSAPISAGGLTSVSASRSAAITTYNVTQRALSVT
jgi:hypothetical protein